MNDRSYTKVFSSIVTSSLWSEDSDTRIVWVTMLALANAHGEVLAAAPGLARVANVPLDACRAALVKFESPDPDSRSKENEGRRIERIDGGWRLLNYQHYRDMMSRDDRLAYQREWDRQNRPNRPNSEHRKPNTPDKPPTNPTKTTQAEAEAEAEAVHTHTTAGTSLVSNQSPNRSECVSVPIQKAKAKFQVDARFKWLEAELCAFYKRPRPNVGRGEEEFLVMEVARRPDLKTEWKEIQNLRAESGERYFPQSLAVLCRDWDKTLDRARNHAPAPTPYKEKSLLDKEADRIYESAMRK